MSWQGDVGGLAFGRLVTAGLLVAAAAAVEVPGGIVFDLFCSWGGGGRGSKRRGGR